MQIVASNLAAVGVTMEIRPMDAASWVTFVYADTKRMQWPSVPAGL